MTIQESNNQIIDLLASGRTVKEIAGALDISAKTVSWRIAKMKKELGCTSTTQLVVKVREQPVR